MVLVFGMASSGMNIRASMIYYIIANPAISKIVFYAHMAAITALNVNRGINRHIIRVIIAIIVLQ